MKKFLSHNKLMPLYGILINLCYKINWFTPIIWLTIYFCETYNKSPTQKNAKTLLALNHNRFRNDLEIGKATSIVWSPKYSKFVGFLITSKSIKTNLNQYYISNKVKFDISEIS